MAMEDRDVTGQPVPPRLLRLTWRQLLMLVLASLALAALLALLLSRLVQASQAVRHPASYALAGQPAPDFTLSTWTWDGSPRQTIHLAAVKGHPIVINFWASWCDACRAEEPVLEAAWQKYRGQGVLFIGVAIEDQQQAGTDFLRQYGVTFPSGPDPTGTIAVAYGIIGVPETVFIDRHGLVRSKVNGALDDGTLDRTLQALLR
jgi:cytochrome c biogenesis protein CcmG/thiol:disulfide interchange protein DsbE